MPPTGLTVRLMREDDVPVFLEYVQVAYDGWPKVEPGVTPQEHLRWKMGDGWPGGNYHFVAELDGQIVAGQLQQTWPAKIRDRELLASCGWDGFVHPDYQGRGIMTEMRAAIRQEMTTVSQFYFGGSNHPAMVKLLERENRSGFAHPWMMLVRPFGFAAAVRAFKLRPGRSPRKLARSLASFARWAAVNVRERVIRQRQQSWELRTVERFDGRIDTLWQEASEPFDFILVRTKDILNWRYADRRAGPFTIRLAEENGRILGYVTVRTMKGVGYITDILALPGRPDVVDSLVRDAARHLRRRGASTVQCWIHSNHPYVSVLRECGFLATRGRRRRPDYLPLSVPEEEMAFLGGEDAAIHVTVGDLDFV